MTFFNKKEDVIKIELTPHGRKLLSKGKLKPQYYAFFDDDILYDSAKAGFSETNTETKSRILSETPYLRPQVSYIGVESNIRDQKPQIDNKMLNMVGSNKIEEKRTNGWKVTFLHNTASSISNSFESSNSPTLQIPQIDCNIEYKIKLENVQLSNPKTNYNFSSIGQSFGNESITQEQQQLLINIIEQNGFNFNEGLEMEVHLYEEDESAYKKLSFIGEKEIIVEGIMVDDEDSFSSLFKTEQRPETPDIVSYWLDIATDSTIAPSDICSGRKKLELNDIYLDSEVECPDEGELYNIYANTAKEIEDCEE